VTATSGNRRSRRELEAPRDLIRFERAGEEVRLEASADATLLVLSGKPIDKPIAGYGPFVLSTREEIMTAMRDVQEGRFGRLSSG